MKKCLILGMVVSLLVIVVSGGVLANGPIAKFGLATGGRAEVTYDGGKEEYLVSTGIIAAFDYLFPVADNIQMGVGFENWQKVNVENAGEFTVFPIYGAINASFSPNSVDITPYLTARVGFNTFNGPSSSSDGSVKIAYSGGLFYSLGGGITFKKNLRAECLYSACSGKMKMTEQISGYGLSLDASMNYHQVLLTFGYSF